MTPSTLVSLSQVARRFDKSIPTVRRAVADGRIEPEFLHGETKFFREDRLPELWKKLQNGKAS
jgi:hypothetical protein